MALYVQFLRKQDQEPEPLATVDNVICAELGAAPDKRNWFYDWYSVLGFKLASGSTLAQLRTEHADDELMLRIIDAIDKHYSIHAYFGR